MTVTLDGSGGVLTRIGAIYRWIKENRLTGNGAAAAGQLPYELEDIYEEYAGADNTLQAAIERLQGGVSSTKASLESLNATLQTTAQSTVIAMVDADDPLPAKTIAEAMRVLVEQMEAATESVAANTVSVTITPGSANVGDGKLIADDLDKYGQQLECAMAEDVLFQRDATAQLFTARGEAAAASRLAVDWPLGSGSTKQITPANADAGAGLLTNGSFNAFTSNTPDGWTVVVGTPGSDIKEETTTKLAGAAALEYDGDAATLSQIRQEITSGVSARTPFAVGLFCKVDVTPAAGSLVIDLFDGSSVIQDDAGNDQSLTIDCTALDTNWDSFGAIFRIADPKPATVYLRVRLATAVSSGSSLFIDNLTAVNATQLYSGGPYCGMVQGGTLFAADDVFTLAVANNRASVYQEACEVLCGTPDLGLRLPTDGSPSITNSLPSY